MRKWKLFSLYQKTSNIEIIIKNDEWELLTIFKRSALADILTCLLWSMKVFVIINLGSQIDIKGNKLKDTPLDKTVRVFPGSIIWEMKIFPQNGQYLLFVVQAYGCSREKLLLFFYIYPFILNEPSLLLTLALLLPSFAYIGNSAFSVFRDRLETAGFPGMLLSFSFQAPGLNSYWVLRLSSGQTVIVDHLAWIL